MVPLQSKLTSSTTSDCGLLHLQDGFRSAAKALTEAVAEKEGDNLELSFATAADTDFLAYVYAQVPPDPIAADLLRMMTKLR